MKFTNLWKYNRDGSRIDITVRIGKVIAFELFWDDDGDLAVTVLNFRWERKGV